MPSDKEIASNPALFLPTDSRRVVPARRAVELSPAQPTAARRAVLRQWYDVRSFDIPTGLGDTVRVLANNPRRVTIVFVETGDTYSVAPFQDDVLNIGWKLQSTAEMIGPSQVIFTEQTHPGIIGWEWWGSSINGVNIRGWEVFRR